jgi:dTDP-L-rhamnose 4-epimerase
MKVLVTGGAGFIGSHVVDRLVARGDEVVVLDNLDPQVHGADATEPTQIASHVASGAVRFMRADVLDREPLRTALDGVEAVVHLAAAVGVGQSMYEPFHYVHTNGSGTGQVLQLLTEREAKVAKLVVASSMSLYGEGAYQCFDCGGKTPRPRDEAQLSHGEWEAKCVDCGESLSAQPTPEDKPADIASIYAATKKHQEDLVVSFGRAYQIPTFALRFFNVYGPRQSLSNPYTGVAAIFMSRLLNGKPPLVFEDGEQSRDFIHVDDIAEAVIRSVDFTGTGAHVLNVGTGRPTTIRQVASVLAKQMGVDIEPTALNRYRAGDIRHCIADTRRAERVLGFRAQQCFEDGVKSLIEWSRREKPRDTVDKCMAELETHNLVR